MVLNALPRLVEILKNQSWDSDHPIAVISRGTQESQKAVYSTLRSVLKDCSVEKIEAPALIVIGQTVNLHEKINWFQKERCHAAT